MYSSLLEKAVMGFFKTMCSGIDFLPEVMTFSHFQLETNSEIHCFLAVLKILYMYMY